MAFELPHGLLRLLASTYGTGSYGEESYGGTGPLDFLANTGWDVLLPLLFGISLILAGLYMIARKVLSGRARNKQTDQQE
jgi:hypothetical protein